MSSGDASVFDSRMVDIPRLPAPCPDVLSCLFDSQYSADQRGTANQTPSPLLTYLLSPPPGVDPHPFPFILAFAVCGYVGMAHMGERSGGLRVTEMMVHPTVGELFHAVGAKGASEHFAEPDGKSAGKPGEMGAAEDVCENRVPERIQNTENSEGYFHRYDRRPISSARFIQAKPSVERPFSLYIGILPDLTAAGSLPSRRFSVGSGNFRVSFEITPPLPDMEWAIPQNSGSDIRSLKDHCIPQPKFPEIHVRQSLLISLAWPGKIPERWGPPPLGERVRAVHKSGSRREQ